MSFRTTTALAALVGAGLSFPALAEPVTLTVWMHEHPPRLELDKAIVTEFEAAHPDVDVELTVFPNAQFDQRLQVGFAGGQGPDVFNNGSFNLGQYLASDILDPVDFAAVGVGSVEELAAKFGVGIKGSTVNGAVYGLPTEVSNYACVANKALWSAAGLDPATDTPQTWDDMVAVAGRLTQRDDAGVPVVRGFDFNWSAPIFMWLTFNAMVDQAGGHVVDEASLEVAFETDAVKKTMQYWSDWVNVHDLGGPQYTASRDAFLAGELATECTFGAWGRGQFEEAGIDYMFFPVPRWADGVTDTGFNAYAYYMMVNAHADAAIKPIAWQFASFYAAHTIELYDEAGLFTAGPEVSALESVKNDKDMKVFVEELAKATYSPRIPGFNEVGDALARARDRIITSSEDMDAVLADLQNEATDILKRQ